MDDIPLPLLLIAVCAAVLAVGLLVVGKAIGPQRNSAVKEMPYESGMDPAHDARRRFDVRFHLVAIAFLIFDVELLFLYPWAVAAGSKGDAGFGQAGFPRLLVAGEVGVFVVLLSLGLVYAWRMGVFRWR